MRNLVLGIIALVAVQFAFVTYTMLLQSSDRLMGDLAVSQPVVINPDVVTMDQAANAIELVTEPGIAAPPIEPRTQMPLRVTPPVTAKREVTYESRVSKPAFIPAPSDSAPPREFAPVVIRYNRNPVPLDCESREEPKTKRRADIAKSRPMIKRPWDWLKAIGSKLN